MIKAEDLRVNNYILVDGIQYRVTGIFHEMSVDNEFYYVQAANKLDYSLDQVDPIELDEEWLIKIGWELDENKIFAFKGDYLYLDIENGKYTYQHPYHPVIIEYVHQLQNLYYALTCTELTIKP